MEKSRKRVKRGNKVCVHVGHIPILNPVPGSPVLHSDKATSRALKPSPISRAESLSQSESSSHRQTHSCEICCASRHQISFWSWSRANRSDPGETSAWPNLPTLRQTDSPVCNIPQERAKHRHCSHRRSSFVFAGFPCALQALPQRSYLCSRPDCRSVDSDRRGLHAVPVPS